MSKELTNLIVDCARGSVQKFSNAEGNEAVRAKFRGILGVEEGASRKEIRKATRRCAAEVYDLIEDSVATMVENNWIDNEGIAALVDRRVLSNGDVNEFYVEDNSIVTMSEFSGGHHDIERQKLNVGKTVQVKTSWYGVKFYDDFELFMMGTIDIAKLVENVYKALDNQMNEMLVQAFLSIEKSVPSQFSITGSVTEDKVVELIEKIEASGAEALIVGSKSALSRLNKLTDANLFSEKAKEQREGMGYVGEFNGTKALKLAQLYKKGTKELAIPTDKLFILPMTGEPPIKHVIEGDYIYSESTDPTARRDMTVECELLAKMGVATAFGADYGVVKFA